MFVSDELSEARLARTSLSQGSHGYHVVSLSPRPFPIIPAISDCPLHEEPGRRQGLRSEKRDETAELCKVEGEKKGDFRSFTALFLNSGEVITVN